MRRLMDGVGGGPGDDAAAAGGPPHAGFTIQEGFEGFLVPQWKFGGAPTVGAAVGGVLGGLAAGKILTTLPFFLLLKPALKVSLGPSTSTKKKKEKENYSSPSTRNHCETHKSLLARVEVLF